MFAQILERKHLKFLFLTVLSAFLLCLYFIFNVNQVNAGENGYYPEGRDLPGYDVLNTKLNKPIVTLNYTSVDDAKNNLTLGINSQVSADKTTPTAYSYKVNSTEVDLPPSGMLNSLTVETSKIAGFIVGQNKISVRLCNAEGCGVWSDPVIFTINKSVVEKVCDPYATGGVCGGIVELHQTAIVNGHVSPYHYTLHDEPLVSGLGKPTLLDSSSGLNLNYKITEKMERFWNQDQTSYTNTDYYQLLVNNKQIVTSGPKTATFNDGEIASHYGYKIGKNRVAVRACNGKGCGPWSDEVIINVDAGSLTQNNTQYCWLSMVEYNDQVVVKAKATGDVFTSGNGVFSDDSDLGAVAAYLGAPVGSIVTLQLISPQANAARCGNSFATTTQNGVASVGKVFSYAKVLANVTILNTLCSGANCLYSNKSYYHTPLVIPQTVAAPACYGRTITSGQVTVQASKDGIVFGSRMNAVNPAGLFTTGSSLPRIAMYLGAKEGSNTVLNVSAAGCRSNFLPSTQNGIETFGWPAANWRSMTVTKQ